MENTTIKKIETSRIEIDPNDYSVEDALIFLNKKYTKGELGADTIKITHGWSSYYHVDAWKVIYIEGCMVATNKMIRSILINLKKTKDGFEESFLRDDKNIIF